MTKPTGRPRGRPPKARVDSEARVDGMINVLTNLGSRGDPNTHNKYALPKTIDKTTLSAIYRSDGLGRRVVDLLPDEATREWIETSLELSTELERIDAKQSIRDAAAWARLFGGAVIFAIIDDGQDADQPLRRNAIRNVLGLRVYDRWRVTCNEYDTDPRSATFSKPKIYQISPLNGGSIRVHASRLHIMDGANIPDEDRQRNQGWGDSVLQVVYQALMNYGLTMTATAGIVRDFVQTILSIKGLTDMLRQGHDDIVKKRIDLIDLTRSVNNSIYLDADGEQYSKHASSVAGLADLWDRFAGHVSASTGIPVYKLMGDAAKGLNATGEGDRKSWYDVVRAYQTDEIQPVVQWIIDLIELQLNWKLRPDDMKWSFPALEQTNEKEWAEIKKITAEADKIYIDTGAVDAEYLYHLRYADDQFKTEISVTDEGYAEWLATRPVVEPSEPPAPIVVQQTTPVDLTQLAEDAVSKAVMQHDAKRDDEMTRAILDALKNA